MAIQYTLSELRKMLRVAKTPEARAAIERDIAQILEAQKA